MFLVRPDRQFYLPEAGLNPACGVKGRCKTLNPEPLNPEPLARKAKIFFPENFQTGINGLGIIEDTAIIGDFFQGLVHSDGWSIGTVGSHGLDHIGDADNAGFKNDIFPRQAYGISRAIQSFMVLQYDVGNRPGKLNAF
jgi:hypothetical protein